MFKVNNKDTSVSSVSIINFEHVIAGWVRALSIELCKSSCIYAVIEYVGYQSKLSNSL